MGGGLQRVKESAIEVLRALEHVVQKGSSLDKPDVDISVYSRSGSVLDVLGGNGGEPTRGADRFHQEAAIVGFLQLGSFNLRRRPVQKNGRVLQFESTGQEVPH